MTRRTPPRGPALGIVLVGVLAGALVLDATSLRAQPTAGDTTRFAGRPGHWALEGATGEASSGFGALYFVSRRTAVGLDASGSYTYLAGNADDTDRLRHSTARAALAAGVRRYVPLRAGLVVVAAPGVLLDYLSYDTEHTSVGYGPFVDLGVAYRVAPRLLVNGLVRASVVRIEQLDAQRQLGGADTVLVEVNAQSRGWSSDLARARVALTLLF